MVLYFKKLPTLLPVRLSTRALHCVASALILVSVAQAQPSRCERLFSDPAEVSTCSTLLRLRGADIPDDQLRDAVLRQLGRTDEDRARARVESDAAAQRKAAADAAAKRRAEEREAGLNRQPVGFDLIEWRLGGFNTVMVLNFNLQNNTPSTLRDFVIACRTFAASGTVLSTLSGTLYEALGPGEQRTYELILSGAHPQASRALCAVARWK